jgi:Uma2 family endonuclease
MSAVLDPPAVAAPDRVGRIRRLILELQPGDSAWLGGVSWDEYGRLMAFRDEARASVRLAYDGGRLAVMSVGGRHEAWKMLIAQLLTAVAVGLRVPRVPVGSLAIRRESLQKGVEPDDCYYVQRAAAMRLAYRRDLDFDTDPPPDLAVEVEMTRDAGGKLPLYAALRVPEVWRWDGQRLTFLHLTPAGEYAERPASLAFPPLTRDLLASYLARAEAEDDITLFLELQAWAAARTGTSAERAA